MAIFMLTTIIYNLWFVSVSIIPAFSHELLLRQVWVIWIPKHLRLFCALSCFLIYVEACSAFSIWQFKVTNYFQPVLTVPGHSTHRRAALFLLTIQTSEDGNYSIAIKLPWHGRKEANETKSTKSSSRPLSRGYKFFLS